MYLVKIVPNASSRDPAIFFPRVDGRVSPPAASRPAFMSKPNPTLFSLLHVELSNLERFRTMAKLVQLTGRLANHLVRPTRLLAGHTSRASSDICNMAGGYHCKQSVRCMSRIIKKRITRIPSDTVVHQEEVDDYQHGPNDVVPLELVNRNPRNLEQLCVECKPLGFELDLPSRNFWNKYVMLMLI